MTNDTYSQNPMVTIRVTPKERAKLRALANAEKLSFQRWARKQMGLPEDINDAQRDEGNEPCQPN